MNGRPTNLDKIREMQLTAEERTSIAVEMFENYADWVVNCKSLIHAKASQRLSRRLLASLYVLRPGIFEGMSIVELAKCQGVSKQNMHKLITDFKKEIERRASE